MSLIYLQTLVLIWIIPSAFATQEYSPWLRQLARSDKLARTSEVQKLHYHLKPDFQADMLENCLEFIIPNASQYLDVFDMVLLEDCAFKDYWHAVTGHKCNEIVYGPTLPAQMTIGFMIYKSAYIQLLEEEAKTMSLIEICCEQYFGSHSLTVECIGTVNRVLIDFGRTKRSPKEMRMQQYFYDAAARFRTVSWSNTRASIVFLVKDILDTLIQNPRYPDFKSEHLENFRQLTETAKFLTPEELNDISICVYRINGLSAEAWDQFCLPMVENYKGTLGGMLVQKAYQELAEKDAHDKTDVQECACDSSTIHCGALMVRVLKNFGNYTLDYKELQMREYFEEAQADCKCSQFFC